MRACVRVRVCVCVCVCVMNADIGPSIHAAIHPSVFMTLIDIERGVRVYKHACMCVCVKITIKLVACGGGVGVMPSPFS